MNADWLQLDEEPWIPPADPDAGVDLLDGATATWITALVLVAAAFAAVLLALLALRRNRS